MKVDRRVWHTRRLLQDSLLEILNDKHLEDISVKEICDRAGVNRSTFYSYFNGTRELLASLKNDFRRVLSGWTADPLFVAAGCRYLTCGAGSVILMWTLGDLPLNREELVSRLYGMMMGGLNRPCPMSGLSARKAVCCEKFT